MPPHCHRPRPAPVLQQREFDAVHRVRQVEKSLLRFMLKPQLLTPIGAYYDNPVRACGLLVTALWTGLVVASMLLLMEAGCLPGLPPCWPASVAPLPAPFASAAFTHLPASLPTCLTPPQDLRCPYLLPPIPVPR